MLSVFKQYRAIHTFHHMATRIRTFIFYNYEIRKLCHNLTSTHTVNSYKGWCKMTDRKWIKKQTHIHIFNLIHVHDFQNYHYKNREQLSTNIYLNVSHTAVQILIWKPSRFTTSHFYCWRVNSKTVKQYHNISVIMKVSVWHNLLASP